MSICKSAAAIRPILRPFRQPRGLRKGRLPFIAALASLFLGGVTLPMAVSAAPTGQPVAYALTPNNTITAIDTGNRSVLRTITLAGLAQYIAGSPDGTHLYVTGETPTGEVVWIIDTRTYTVTSSIPLDNGPIGMVVSKNGGALYVATQDITAGPGLVAYDTTTHAQLAAENLGNSSDSVALGITLSPDGKRVYVPMVGQKVEIGGLAVFDTASNGLVAGPQFPDAFNQWFWAAISPDSSKILGSVQYEDNAGDEISGNLIFDAATGLQVGTAQIGTARLRTPLPNSTIIYGTTGYPTTGGSLVVYDVQTNAVTATVPIANSIDTLALTPDGKQLYVSDSNAQSIAVVDTATHAVVGSVAVAGATQLAIIAAPPPFVATPPLLNLSGPDTVVIGWPPTLVWTSTGATSCTASGAWSGTVELQGSAAAAAVTAPGSRTYTLTCTGPGGTTAVSKSITVIAGSSISLAATDILLNGTTTVSWRAFAGARNCQLSVGQSLISQALSGAVPIGTVMHLGSGTVSLQCDGPPGAQTVSASYSVYSPGALGYASAALPFNVYAIGTPGSAPLSGGLGGSGYALDGPDLLALPQADLTAFGQKFTLGSAGKPSGISSQKISLGTTRLTQLIFVASAINGPQLNQKFVVTYADGSTATYTQSLSDWKSHGGYPGEDGYDPATNTQSDEPLGSADRITPSGGSQSGGWFLHKYRLLLDDTKVATSLQLPNNRNVTLFALNVTRAPKATAVPLGAAFNVSALATAGQASTAPRLASGYAYDASLVPNGFTGLGQTFTIGAANQPDAVSTSTVALEPTARLGLTLLATGVNGRQASQSFKVTYQDGSTTVFNQNVSDWNQPQNYAGEAVARSTGFRITPTGTRQAGSWNIYAYTFQTDPGKKVVSLTLPSNRNVVVLSLNSLSQ